MRFCPKSVQCEPARGGSSVSKSRSALQVLRRSPPRRIRGAAAVELALLFPFLMAILFGILEWSFVVYNKGIVANAAREGARAGIVLSSPRLTQAQIEAKAQSYCNGKLIAMVGSVNCTAVATMPRIIAFQAPLRVTVSFSYTGSALLQLFKVMNGTLDLSESVAMYYE